MAKIRLEKISKHFGKVTAVENLDLVIKEREFFGLLGPSGSGKTTALRLIAGLEELTLGEIYFDDEPVSRLSPSQRNIALVFQNYSLYPHMSVYNNIAFPLKMRKVPKLKCSSRVEEVARLLRIENLLNRKPRELSGGQQQRVALARSLVRNPRVFLMDEPLSNLDAKLRASMRVELKTLHKRLGITTIYVTHDQVEAMALCHRVAVINEGKLQQVAQPRELYQRPANTWVADFIGSPPMNLIECSIANEGGNWYLRGNGFSHQVEGRLSGVLSDYPGRKITLGIRPESIVISQEEAPGSIKAQVGTVEPLGDSLVVHLYMGEGGTIPITVKSPPSLTVSPDEAVSIHFSEDGVLLYDKNGKLLA